jgi:hypothetical protein
MIPVGADAVAFPALWLFLLGLILSLGVYRMRRARHDVRDDWNRLVRFHAALHVVEATRGGDEAARIELLALARALDDAVEPAAGRPGLAALAGRFAAGAEPGGAGVSGAEAQAWSARLREDVLAVDRALQARMKTSARDSGRIGPVFLAGTGAILLLPLHAARTLGLVQRLTARRVEDSLWFHAAVGVVVFIVLAGTVLAALQVGTVASRLAGDLGLR